MSLSLSFQAFCLMAALCFAGTILPLETENGNEETYISVKELQQLLQGISEEEVPMQLLKPTLGHERLELNEMALEKLRNIEEPVAFVAVVGPYHGGKSFLLNVLLNSTQGFTVSSTAETETRGIWIRIVSKRKLQGVDGSQVILLDTEGLYGDKATRLYDAKVFALATLLSSHLVYNTLRTLGDAQSVSSLADLSKHAQIFNLQNWLHTADSGGEDSISIDLNTSLLMTTLDFPPLTWVVQGFDIDLQPSKTPMDYIQRYLAAEIKSGDNTLDTLFFRGISCYTLRTPADLNSIRETYGSKGLAADEDLFNNLHPNYLKDVENLRTAVLANLTSKGEGKLTGENTAALLPILVHYVNEDFPLHAERKLRDVLVDIIVDGAFGGGVQYFEKEMKFRLLRSEKIKISRKFLSSLEDLEILGDLVMSALTSEDLDKILDLTENKAVDYCHRRCVGVPALRARQACVASLPSKIKRMKPFYRDQNDLQVREILIHLGEILRQKAEKILFEIKLPVPASEIQNNCSKVIHEALERYEDLVGPHKGSRLYEEARKKMQEEISVKCDRVTNTNNQEIHSILNSGKVEYQIAYNHAFSESVKAYRMKDENYKENVLVVGSERLKRPAPPKVLAEIHASCLTIAQQAFDTVVINTDLSWIRSSNEHYDFYQFQCLQWSKQRFQELQVQNKADIVAYCRNMVSDIVLDYKEGLARIRPFPDNDEIISEKADIISKQGREMYASSTKEYEIPEVGEKRKELIENMEASKDQLIEKNTILMAAYCYEPLMKAYKELHMEDCERTIHNIFLSLSIWSLKCLWPGPHYTYGFKHFAYATAQNNLEKAQSFMRHDPNASATSSGVVLSPTTQKKVIQGWIDRDLAQHSNVVLTNFGSVVTLIVLITTILRNFKGPSVKRERLSPNGKRI